MNTIECIDYIRTHPWMKKVFGKLKLNEVEYLVQFINELPNDKNAAMEKANRMFIGKEKPKNYLIIMECASVIITHKFN